MGKRWGERQEEDWMRGHNIVVICKYYELAGKARIINRLLELVRKFSNLTRYPNKNINKLKD